MTLGLQVILTVATTSATNKNPLTETENRFNVFPIPDINPTFGNKDQTTTVPVKIQDAQNSGGEELQQPSQTKGAQQRVSKVVGLEGGSQLQQSINSLHWEALKRQKTRNADHFQNQIGGGGSGEKQEDHYPLHNVFSPSQWSSQGGQSIDTPQTDDGKQNQQMNTKFAENDYSTVLQAKHNQDTAVDAAAANTNKQQKGKTSNNKSLPNNENNFLSNGNKQSKSKPYKDLPKNSNPPDDNVDVIGGDQTTGNHPTYGNKQSQKSNINAQNQPADKNSPSQPTYGNPQSQKTKTNPQSQPTDGKVQSQLTDDDNPQNLLPTDGWNSQTQPANVVNPLNQPTNGNPQYQPTNGNPQNQVTNGTAHSQSNGKTRNQVTPLQFLANFINDYIIKPVRNLVSG